MGGADLQLLTQAARDAGVLAMGYFRQSPDAWDKAGGAGPVSEADLAVDRLLRERLPAARPGTGWLSEETADGPERLATDEVFILDPIDGTRAFLAGEPAWAVALALVRKGRVISAVVHLPAQELTYTATEDGPAELNGHRIRVPEVAHHPATVLAAKRYFHPAHWPGGMPELSRQFRPSLAWRLALVAEGRFDAMLTLGDAWEWDIAAGCLIAERAGAVVTTRDGEPPRFNNPHPAVPGLVVAGAPLHEKLMRGLTPRDGTDETRGGAEPRRSV